MQRAEALFERYGTRALEVSESLAGGHDAPLHALTEYSDGEIGFLAANEKVVHLDDVLLRRTMLGMLGRATRAVIAEIAGVLAQQTGWDARRKESEIARTLALLKNNHQLEL